MSQIATATFSAIAFGGWLALVLWAFSVSRHIDKGGE